MRAGSFRLHLLISLFLLVPLGFATKFYAGPASGWVQAHAGGVLYVVFWTMVVLGLRPALSASTAAGGVFVATCLLEGLQCWHPAPLEAIRSTFIGHAVLGSTFSWWDFPHYVAGAIVGGLTGHALRPSRRTSSSES